MKTLFSIALVGLLSILGFSTNVEAQDKYIGTITWYGFNFCPRGELPANGALLPISAYSAVFSLLGTYYGGDGITTFALPNLYGRFAIGAGNGLGLTPRVLGEASGAENVTILTSNMPAHSHSLATSASRANTTNPSNALLAQSGTYTTRAGTGAALAPNTVGVTGGSQPINIMPPYLGLTPCVTVEGIYPSRP